MVKYTGRFHAPIAMAAFALLAACGGDRNNADSALAADSTLNADLAMAGSDTMAQPQLNDVPATSSKTPSTSSSSTKSTPSTSSKTTPPPPAPSSGNTVTPAPTGSSGGGASHTIAAGTALALRTNSEVCTNTGHVGDTYTATTTAPVRAGGARIPAGATVTMRVTQLKRSENVRDKIIMAFEVQSIRFGGKTYAISGNITNVAIDRVRNEPKSNDVKKVVGGAAIGAIAGQILGKSTKSTVIGAAAGAAAGAGAAAATANYEGCIRSGSAMTVTLSQPLTIVAQSGGHRTVLAAHKRRIG